MLSFTYLGLALLQLSSAHFVLNYPPSLGFDDELEGNEPCGGQDITFADNDTNVPVGGFSISVLSTHPQAQWLFRATLSQEAPFNWTNLLPVVEASGLGNFCPTGLTAPEEFEGQKGVIQVIQGAVDGNLYQCAAVNFVTGVNSTIGSACTNATGVTATITDQQNFTSSEDTSSSSTASGTASATASSTSSSAATATSSSAAAIMHPVSQSMLSIVLALPLGLMAL
ncbi:hypothetical protein DV738_g3304, partial [Chaetothyriales sp. CBS 135597]